MKFSIHCHYIYRARKKVGKLQINDWLFVIGDHMGIPSQQGAMQTGELVANKINQLMQ